MPDAANKRPREVAIRPNRGAPARSVARANAADPETRGRHGVCNPAGGRRPRRPVPATGLHLHPENPSFMNPVIKAIETTYQMFRELNADTMLSRPTIPTRLRA